MKYKHCPDCGSLMAQTRSHCGWGEYYDCTNKDCQLKIHITHGEPHHMEPDREEWTRKPKPIKAEVL